MTCLAVLLFTSCGETHEENNEYTNWQERNEAYFSTIYATAKQAADNGDTKWKIFKAYSKNSNTISITDYIVAEVITEGDGEYRKTMTTDSVSMHYSGRLMPSESYKDGYLFDSSWTGEYNLMAMKPYNGVVGDYVDGYATALMKMRPGDRWKVYIPHNLGYGSQAKTGIPAYSTLVFDITFLRSWPKRITY